MLIWHFVICNFSFSMFTGLGECFQMRWCTISAKETEKCNDFKTVIPTLATQASLPNITFSCVQGSNAVDCMKKIQSGLADLITLDGGEILTAGKKAFSDNVSRKLESLVTRTVKAARTTSNCFWFDSRGQINTEGLRIS